VKDGYKKVMMQTPFGQSCHWSSEVKRKRQNNFAVLAAASVWPCPSRPRSLLSALGKMSLQDASLTEVIAQLARQLHINYTLTRVKDGMIFSTYGDTSRLDARSLLDLILRIDGAALLEKGDVYRIVPPRTPVYFTPPETAARTLRKAIPPCEFGRPEYVTVTSW